MKRLTLLLCLLLCACFDVPGGNGKPARRFIARPIQVVTSDLFTPECLDEIMVGWDFVRDLGVSLSLASATVDFPAFHDIPIPGVIAVKPGMLESGPGYEVLGEAQVAYSPILGGILAALVTIDHCDARVFAHELGHALGLPHENSPQNLMHAHFEQGGWGLTEEQKLHVAD